MSRPAARARPGLRGLFHRLPGAGRVALGLPDPRQRGQASGQRLGEVHLAARPDSLADVPEGRVELVPLIGHLGQAHIRDARGGQGSPAGRCGVLERLPVGAGRGVQAALGPLDLAEVLVAPGSHGGLAGRPPLGDARRQRALGLCKLAAQPLGHAQVPVGVRCQHPLALADLGKGPAAEGDRAFGVAMEHGEEGAPERDRRRHVGQVARGPADRRLERLIGHARSACQRALGGIQRDLGRLHAVAEESQARLGQQQPRPRARSPAGSAASHRCRVAPSLRRRNASACRSTSRIDQAASPAARAWRTASSARP